MLRALPLLPLCLCLAQLTGAAVIRKPGCVVSTLAGTPFPTNPNQDGDATQATFQVPLGVAVNASNYVFVADHINQALRIITPGPNARVTRVNSSAPSGLYGRGAKTAATEPFDGPNAVAVSPVNQRVYLVTNTTLFFYDPANATQVGAVWPGAQDILGYATGLAADTLQPSVLYVTDYERNAVVRLTLLPQSVVLTVLAGGTIVPVCTDTFCPEGALPKLNAFDGAGALAVFGEVGQLVHDASAGRLLIADLSAHLIRSLNLTTNAVTTVSGNVTRSTNATGDGNPNAGNDDGLGAAVRYRQPYGLAIVGPGSAVVVSDSLNNALRVLSLDSRGEAFTIAGAASVGGGDFVNGDGAAARFWDPAGMATALDGSVVVADAVNGAIRRVTCNFFNSPTASPTPSLSPTASHTPSLSPGASPSVSASPSVTPSASATPPTSPSPTVSPTHNAPAPPAPEPAAASNILGPVVLGGLRAGALAIIIVSVVAALGGAFALWWYCGGGSAIGGAGTGNIYTSASLAATGQPGSPKAYGALDSSGSGAVANPYMAATSAVAGAGSSAVAPALPGGVQEWGPAPNARQHA